MKQTILAILLSVLLIGCQNEIPWSNETGSLQLESIMLTEIANESLTRANGTLTRAIDADLIVEICQDGKVVTQQGQTLRFTNGEFPRQLSLPAGQYEVRAFNAAYEAASAWTESEVGDAVYYKEEKVAISANQVTRLAMQVPMINVGVTFTLPDDFNQHFSSYSFTITDGTRTVSVTSQQTVYLDVTPSFTVTLQAVNVDQENMETSLTHQSIAAGTVYTVAYQLAATKLKGRIK